MRGIFVSQEVAGLCPPELSFLKLVLNSDRLTTNVARDALEDCPDAQREIRQLVEETFPKALNELSKQEF